MKSNKAFILTVLSIITSHITTYLKPGYAKYSLAVIGALFSIYGAYVLWGLRKVFVKCYTSSDWEAKDDSYIIRITKEEHKKDKLQNVDVERSTGSGSYEVAEVVTEVNSETSEVIIWCNVPDLIGDLRVRIK